MATSSPPGNGQLAVAPGSLGTSGNVQDGSEMKLGLVIGVPLAAVLVIALIIILVLWKMGKLKRSNCNHVRRRSKDTNTALREERKKSIVVIAPKGKQGVELYKVRYFYQAQDENQLTLHTGRILEVQEKLPNGWWRGVAENKEGWFPSTFVQKIDVSDPNCSMSHSLSSTLESKRPHPPAPTGTAPVDHHIYDDTTVCSESAPDDEVCYMNNGFVKENDSSDTEVAKSEQSNIHLEEEADKDIDARLSTMETKDIEGYLNEIFTVEDEVTPNVQRKSSSNKLRLSKRSRDSFHRDTNQKKLKDEQNSKMLKEKSQKANKNKSVKNGAQTAVNGKPARSKKSKSSPLINPMHYMISSTESLMSTSSCCDEPDQPGKISPGLKDLEPKAETPEKVSDDSEDSRAHDDDVHRGAPDGSSLVGVRPNCLKELSLEKTVGTEGELDTTDDLVGDPGDNDYETVAAPNKVSLLANLKDQLRKRTSENRPMYVSMYPFTPNEHNQLKLSRNDVIYSLGQEDNGWMKGEKKSSGEIGWFPMTYVREGKMPPGADMASEESEEFDSDEEFEDEEVTGPEYLALYPFQAEQDGDLTIQEGDLIIVLETLDNGWWRGCLGDQEGWFPGTFVEPVPQTPASFSLYEDVFSPPANVLPLSTSTPTETEAPEVTVIDSSPTSVIPPSKDYVCTAAPLEEDDNQSTPGDKHKKHVLSPLNLKFKPHVPRRFIKPKIVAVPKRRHSTRKSTQTPSRPPPPVPKEDGSQYSTMIPNGVPVSDCMKPLYLDNDKGLDDLSVGEKHKSVPRPKVPPPPVPVIPTDTSFVSRVTDQNLHGENDSIIKDSATKKSSSINSVEKDNLHSNFEHGSSIHSNIRRTTGDSGYKPDSTFTSSPPGVHTNARSKASSESGDQTSVLGTKLNGVHHPSHDHAIMNSYSISDSKKETITRSDNTLSFGAIMNIFERIVQKTDSPADGGRSVVEYDDSLGAMLKPPIPPKPEESQLKFRRTQSEPNLLTWKATSGLSVLEADLHGGHRLVPGLTQDQSNTDNYAKTTEVINVKSTGQKPSLPPRPKFPPQRSKSVVSTLSSTNGVLSSTILDRDKVLSSAEHKDNAAVKVKDKPQKPLPPVAMLNGSPGKDSNMVANKSLSVHSNSKLLYQGADHTISKTEYSVQYGRQPKTRVGKNVVPVVSFPSTSGGAVTVSTSPVGTNIHSPSTETEKVSLSSRNSPPRTKSAYQVKVSSSAQISMKVTTNSITSNAKVNSFDAMSVKATKSPASSVKATPSSVSSVKATPSSVPSVMATTASIPSLKATPSSIPSLKATPSSTPSVKATTSSTTPNVKASPSSTSSMKATSSSMKATSSSMKATPSSMKATPSSTSSVKATSSSTPSMKVKPSSTTALTSTFETSTKMESSAGLKLTSSLDHLKFAKVKDASKNNIAAIVPPSRPNYSPRMAPSTLPAKSSVKVKPLQKVLITPTITTLGADPAPKYVNPTSQKSIRQKIISNGSLKLSSSPEVKSQPYDSIDGNLVSHNGMAPQQTLKVDTNTVNDSIPSLSPGLPALPTSSPPDLCPSTLPHGVSSTEEQQGLMTSEPPVPPPLKRVISPMNIRTSPLRFFTPTGYSRSGSTSSLSSATLSPLTMSPVGSTGPTHSTDNNTISAHLLNSDSDLDSLPRFKAPWPKSSHNKTLDHDIQSRPEPARHVLAVSPNRSPTSPEKSNPLRFYTPAAFVPRREKSPIDTNVKANEESIPGYQASETYSSEQNLAPDYVGDIEKYGSTGSLNYHSARLYQPYASVEVKQDKKHTLTPPKPFIPSTWSAYHNTDKMAMVNIDIDDEDNTLKYLNEAPPNDDVGYDSPSRRSLPHPSVYILDNKLLKGGKQRKFGASPLQYVAQGDLESDV